MKDTLKVIMKLRDGGYLMWYVFFYRKNGGKIKGVLGRERTNDLLGSIL